MSARAQLQQAWVADYNNSLTNGNHQALKIALDSSNNIYICGFSQNTNGGTGYATLKYAPNGNQLWAERYDSTNYPTATPSALALDGQGRPAVTGNALTVKYNTDGSQLWTAPYAGAALAADTNGNVFVTGFGTNFNTVRLSPTGSNLWLEIYKDVGPTIGQAIVVDSSGNAFVTGSDVFNYYSGGTVHSYQIQFLIVKFTPAGAEVWGTTLPSFYKDLTRVQVEGVALDSDDNLCVAFQFPELQDRYNVYKVGSDGSVIWGNQNPSYAWGGPNVGYALATDKAGDVFVTGQSENSSAYGAYKANTNGSWLWTNIFPLNPTMPSAATSIAVDFAGNSYVTGYSPDANGTNDIVTIAYDTNGKQLWLQRYTGVANYGAVGNAIAVDKGGNVYVAGYENVPGGGTEMVLIKYAPVTLQHQSNGNFLLQAQGAAGEPFDIQASTNLQSWSDLGLQDANTNGLLQYLDTNTALYPYRFYLAIPEP